MIYENHDQEIGAIKALQSIVGAIKNDPDLQSVGFMSGPALVRIMEEAIMDATYQNFQLNKVDMTCNPN